MYHMKDLNKLLLKRLNYLKKFSEKEKLQGYCGLSNIKLENNTITINNNIEDCKYIIINDAVNFDIVGKEGMETVSFPISNINLKLIKKIAQKIDCGGLK